MWRGKSTKKVRSNEENYQEGLQQKGCTDGRTSNTTKNIGEDQKGIGDDGRVRNRKREGR